MGRDEDETLWVGEPAAAATDLGSFAGFRLLRVLGEGGMGTVYEGEQQRPRRSVALKVIRPGLASPQLLRRFEIEAEALARLQHPGIAHVYEVGTADTGAGSQPFFAMELVDGSTLTRFATENALDAADRMRLMVKICDAVHHAHQKGVIHRDLKPANILVTRSGEPKILDFGVARVTDSDLKATVQTSVGQIIGTLPYMSPEQVAADPHELDTRSDVYALGVVLFELLTGRLPQDLSNRSLVEAARLIQHVEPATLSSADRSLRGDPETIVAKALEKDKKQRYQSVAELRADLERFLSDQPIAARPPSSIYQLRKFARRNRALVAGGVATMLMLVAGVIASSTFAVREARQRQRAEVEADTAERVTAFVIGLFRRASPGSRNPESISVREVLDQGADAARSELDEEPVVKARVLNAIGSSYYGLNLFDESLELHTEALEVLREVPHADDVEVARALVSLAAVHGAYEEEEHGRQEERLVLEAIRILERRWRQGDRETNIAALLGRTYIGLGDVYTYGADRTRREEAVPAYEQAIRYNELAYGRGHVNVAWSYSNVGSAYLEMRQWEQARSYYEQGLAIAEAVVGRHHVAYATIEMNLADALIQLDESELAEPLVQHAAATFESILGGEHIRVAAVRRAQAFVAFGNGRPQEAERYLLDAIRIATELVGPGFELNGRNKVYLGDLMAATGRDEEARRFYREAADILGLEPAPDDDLRRRLDEWGVEPSAALARAGSGAR